MSSILSVAVSLSPAVRQNLGIQALSRSVPISHLAAEHQVSRKFVYQPTVAILIAESARAIADGQKERAIYRLNEVNTELLG